VVGLYSEFSTIKFVLRIFLWYVTPCSLVTCYFRFGENPCFSLTSKLEIQTTRLHVPEGRKLWSDHCENLMSEVRFGEVLFLERIARSYTKNIWKVEKVNDFNSVMKETSFPTALIA
jgi:hypothetical protein